MLKRILGIIVAVLTIYACANEEEGPSLSNDFDRGVMLTSLADNIIIPAFDSFSIKMSALKATGETFTANPNQTNLDALRTSWLTAYKSWQYIEMYDIGKAEELQYKFYMNIYPVTVADVEANISNGNYDLNSVNNQDAQGFTALDYMLYGVASSDTDILAKFTTDTNNDNYKNYITAVLNQMNSLTQQVVTDWSSYRNEFVMSTSNTATSAVNKLVNDYIFYYEKGLRANKFGIPAGIFSSTSLPEKVEGLYKKDISKELALDALNAVINLFEGGSTTSSASFKGYLIALDRQDLASEITNQFNVAKTQINTLDSSFYDQINTDNTQMTRSYDELQKVVILLKVDMLQTFNVNVDYVDADGD